jgi:protein-tyrosine phosphatase
MAVRYSPVGYVTKDLAPPPAPVHGLDPFSLPDVDTVIGMSAIHTDRHVALESAFNFRDLGGYPAGPGRRTRWRTLFRADGLHRLTEPDLEILRRLGLCTVIDLRTENELVERGRFPIDAHPVGYHHLSLMDVIWDPAEAPAADEPATAFLLGKYIDMVSTAEDRVAEAFRILAGVGALPAVFHCAAGKDRTGVLAGVLLSTLGVADEDVVADYALTAQAMTRMQERWAAESEEARAALAATPAAFMAADPAAMAGLLALISQEHGSTRDYVRSLGVSDDVLAGLDEALLEPV